MDETAKDRADKGYFGASWTSEGPDDSDTQVAQTGSAERPLGRPRPSGPRGGL